MTTAISSSKIGVHLESVWNVDELNRLAKSGARIFVVINEFKYAQVIHNECPGATIFFRHYDLGEWLTAYIKDGADLSVLAGLWCLKIAAYRDAMPWAIFIGTNEYQPDATPEKPDTLPDWQRLAAFEQARIRQGFARGIRIGFGGFGVSHPKDSQWDNFKAAFAPVFEAANAVNKAGGMAVYCSHEYSAGIMSLYYGPNTEQNVLSGNVVPFPTMYTIGNLTCHYRKVYNEMVYPFGYDVPFAVTECGNDYIASAGAHKQFGVTHGWTECGAAAKFSGESSNEARFIRALSWYDAQLRADSYMIGGTVFTWNTVSWGTFRMNSDPIEKPFLAYLLKPSTAIPVPLAVTPAEPAEPPDEPDVFTGNPPFRGRVKLRIRLNFRQDADPGAGIWSVLEGGTEFEIWQSANYVKSVQAAKAGWICVRIGVLVGFVAFSYCELL